jgi:hypothetical protein
MEATWRSHRQLLSTWPEALNLFGELAAVAVDGEAFDIFRRLEGCQSGHSGLAQQTLIQAQAATHGLGMLLRHVDAAQMIRPDTSSVKDAV